MGFLTSLVGCPCYWPVVWQAGCGKAIVRRQRSWMALHLQVWPWRFDHSKIWANLQMTWRCGAAEIIRYRMG